MVVLLLLQGVMIGCAVVAGGDGWLCCCCRG